MLQYSEVSIANFNSVQLVIHGDGVSSVFKANLTKPPFNLVFGPLPTVTVDSNDPDNDATGDVSANGLGEAILTLTFTSPPTLNERIGPTVTFLYPSL